MQVLFIGTALMLLLFGISKSPLLLEEPRRALVALEMYYSGNIWAPTIHGELYLNKPPLFNWLILLIYNVFGVVDWAGRVITILSWFALSFLTYRLARIHFESNLSLTAALLVAASVDILFYFSFLGEIDLFYSALTFLGFYLLYFFGHNRRYGRMFLSIWLNAGLGFLTKGLPSLLFAGLSLLGFLIWKKDLRMLFGWKSIGSFLIGMILPVLYLYFYHQQGADAVALLRNLFFESGSRVNETAGGIGAFLLHWFSFPFILLLACFPSGFLLIRGYKERFQSIFAHPLLMFCLVIFMANIFPYWISTGTRSRYLYMFYPLIAIPAAYYLHRFPFQNPVALRLVNMGLSMLALAGAVFLLLDIPISDLNLPEVNPAIILLFSLCCFCAQNLIVRYQINGIHGFLMALLCLRLLYGIVLVESRIQSSNASKDKALAEAIYEEVSDQTLTLDKGVELSFTVSYYLQKNHGSIIYYHEPKLDIDYMIASPTEVKGQELMRFSSRGKEWVLFRNQ